MADLSKLRLDGTDYNVKDASAPTRKFTNAYSKTGNLPISSDDTTQTAVGKLENNLIPKSAKGTANGVAELDANGKVPSSQLPSYVDDVLEYSAKSSFPATGETGKIYVDTTTNKTYRWSGSAYVEISESLALGETDSTAYRGDRGKAAYDHSQTTSGNPHNVTKSDVGLGNVGNFKAVSTAASQGLSDTEKANARANIGAGTGNGTYSKPSGGIPKSDLASAVQTALDQVNTNKTNILYGLNTGVKNKLPCQISDQITASDAGIKVTYNDDGSYTCVGTKTNNDSYVHLLDIDASKLPGTHEAYISFTGTGECQIAAYGYNGSTWTLMLTTTGAQSFNVGNYSMIKFRLRFTGSLNSSYNVVAKPMVCTEDAWNQSHDFMPPSLPNYDLTYLQAEDRASLAEVVDSGAKNKAPTASIVKTVTTPSFTPIIPCSFPAGTYHVKFNYTMGNVGTFCLKKSDASTTLLNLPTLIPTGTGTYEADFTISEACGGYNIYGENTANLSNIMICTKAAFGVSPKFVPYAKSNYSLTQLTSGLSDTAYKSATVVQTKVKDVTGGYIQIGKMVVVNIRCTANENISFSTPFFGALPRPIVAFNEALTSVCMTNNLNELISLLGNGNISTGGNTTIPADQTIILSCVYFTND